MSVICHYSLSMHSADINVKAKTVNYGLTYGSRRRIWNERTKFTELLKALCLPQNLNGIGAQIIRCMHDEIIVETLKANAEEVAVLLNNTMKEAGEFYLKSVQARAKFRLRKPGRKRKKG